MTDAPDDFEKRLAVGLREWTDAAAGPRPWADHARAVVTTASRRARRSRWMVGILAFGTSAAAVLAVAAVSALCCMGGDDPGPVASGRTAQHSDDGRAQASASPPSVSPAPSVTAGAELELDEIAWWDQQTLGFGFVEPPAVGTPVHPPPLNQVRIGTLDGRVTALLTISAERPSYVSGPVGGEVLVVDDLGGSSRVVAVRAADGSITEILTSDNLVTAAVLAPDGSGVYYSLAMRGSGRDLGVQYRDRRTGRESAVDPPQADLDHPVDSWQLALTPDGSMLLAQRCRGEAACTTRIIDLSAGVAEETTLIGRPIGMADHTVIARRTGGDEHVALDLRTLDVLSLGSVSLPVTAVRLGDEWFAAMAVDEGTGSIRLVRLSDGQETEVPHRQSDVPDAAIPARAQQAGYAAPDGWILRLQDPPAHPSMMERPEGGPSELVDVLTGERVTIPRFEVAWPADSCEPILPAEMPSGAPVGGTLRTLEDGVEYARWGTGDDHVIEVVGRHVETFSEGGPERLTTVRGHDATLAFAGIDVYPGALRRATPAITWQENGCAYSLLLPGATIDEALDYAPRF